MIKSHSLQPAFRAFAVFALLVFPPARLTAADDSSFALAVKRSHAIGSSTGTLRLTATGIEFETADKDDARRWPYSDIQQIQIDSPKRISVLSYEDQGVLRAGADRRFDFEVQKESISPEMIAFLLDHTNRRVVTAVLPPVSKTPLFQLPVKHERHGRGSEGVLLMYDDALVYGTERVAEARYWRFTDIFAVLPLDRDRLQVLAYEGGSGDLRPFTFQLKSALSDEFARALWVRVNPPAPFVVPAATDRGGTSTPNRER